MPKWVSVFVLLTSNTDGKHQVVGMLIEKQFRRWINKIKRFFYSSRCIKVVSHYTINVAYQVIISVTCHQNSRMINCSLMQSQSFTLSDPSYITPVIPNRRTGRPEGEIQGTQRRAGIHLRRTYWQLISLICFLLYETSKKVHSFWLFVCFHKPHYPLLLKYYFSLSGCRDPFLSFTPSLSSVRPFRPFCCLARGNF